MKGGPLSNTDQFSLFVDSALGNDGNSGKSPAQAFASTAPLTANLLTPGVGVGFAYGSIFRTQFAPAAGGTLLMPVRFGAYGRAAAGRPKFYNSVAVSNSSWTNVQGNEYSTPTGASGPNTGGPTPAITWIDGSGTQTFLFKGTSGSLTANQWALSGGALHVNIGRAPISTDTFEVGNPTSSVSLEHNYMAIDSLDIGYSGNYAVSSAVNGPVIGLSITNSIMQRSAADGWNVNTSGTGIVSAKNVYQNLPADGGGGGDGFSAHGPSQVTLFGDQYISCGKDGADMSGDATFVVKKCSFSHALFTVGGSGGTDNGSLAMSGCTFDSDPTTTDVGSRPYHLFINSVTQDFRATLYNLSLNAGTKVSAKYSGIGVYGGVVSMLNTIVEGAYDISVDVRGSAQLINDYNDVHGGALLYGGTVAGSHSISASPLYTSPSTGNFALQNGSPCIGTGTVAAGTTAAPVNMGSTGAQ